MPETRHKIFISYRRSDAGGSTTAIRKTLIDQFGSEAVFHDVDSISLGAEFPQALRSELARAAVVLAVIGRGWLLAANEYNQRRIDFEDDWVAIELSTALKLPEVTLIPVLVDGARMPPEQALPTSLRALASKNAVTLHHEAWDDTVQRLLARISEVLQPLAPQERPGTAEALTPALIRQVVAEALESVGNVGEQVLLATVDELSRTVATMTARALAADELATLSLLLRRLVGRPVVRVAAYMREIIGNPFSCTTDQGKWLGYAITAERDRYEQDLKGCVLLLPGASVDGALALVVGAAVVESINLDYYGAAGNDPPGPYETATRPVAQLGRAFSG